MFTPGSMIRHNDQQFRYELWWNNRLIAWVSDELILSNRKDGVMYDFVKHNLSKKESIP
jgi:hypothetical protein